MALSRNDLEARVRSFEYWHYPIDLGEGLVTNADAEQALALRDFIWPALLDMCGGSLAGMRVLDAGCNAGFWSLEAHRSGAEYVLGIDARKVHIDQAELVRTALDVNAAHVEFREMSIYDVTPQSVGEYDVCLMLRILHHLSHPLLALQRIRSVCRKYLIVDVKLLKMRDGPFLYVHSEDLGGVLNGVEGLALRPNRQALKLMLTASGFSDIQRLRPNATVSGSYRSGSRAVFTAVAGDVARTTYGR